MTHPRPIPPGAWHPAHCPGLWLALAAVTAAWAVAVFVAKVTR
jgi:hypothetical protein